MNRQIGWLTLMGALAGASSTSIFGCDLCAINSATTARAETTGFAFTLSSQYIHAHTLQFQSDEFKVPNQEFLESTIAHIIPAYNFTRDVGISLNVPIARKEARLYDPGAVIPRDGKSEGLGDISLIARWTPWSIQEPNYAFRFNLLAGAKFPTGDTRYLRQDVAQNTALGPGHNHAFSGVHLHELSLGSGSADGVFGLTTYTRWRRLFASTEAQYYLRTAAEAFEYGDSVMISGGPGAYLIMGPRFTLNLQAIGRYENTESSFYDSQLNTETGMREIYFGPQIGANIGQHFSGNIGVDIPLDIRNRGLQVVPTYRLHATITWSF